MPRSRSVLALRRAAVALAGALSVVAAVAPTALAVSGAPPTPDVADGSPVVVVIGTAGLRWDDVHTLSTPALWDLSREASIGTVAARSIRSSACPADGWLALSAGARAGDLPGQAYGECRPLRNPLANGSACGWSDYLASAQSESYDPVLGLLGQTVSDAGLAASGIGPGAAIALAGTGGVVRADYRAMPADPDDLQDLAAAALRGSSLVVVDVGSVRDAGRATVARPDGAEDTTPGEPGAGEEPDQPYEPAPTGEEPAGPEVITEPTRSQQVQPIDARVGAVLDAVAASDRDVTVLLVSLADSGTRARMQLMAAMGPAAAGDDYAESLLGSRSTRQGGMVQATDVTPTVLAALGLADRAPVGSLVGSAITAVDGPDDANARMRAVLDIDLHSARARSVSPRFYTLVIVANLLLYAVVSLGLNGRVLAAAGRSAGRWLPRRVRERIESTTRHPVPVLHTLRVAGVAVGALPVASTLANATPWWRAPSGGWALTGLVVLWVGIVSAAALVPRWRHPIVGPLGVVAGATALVLGLDAATGATLQVSAPLGVQPVVAGRFYGFNNTAFALFAAATLLCAMALADPLVRTGRRRAAALGVAAVGVVATVLDGLPGLGSDFGGPPALVPAFAVLALLALGMRLSWGRLVGVLGAGAVVVVGFAVLDWLRPPESRTHLGRFVDTVLDGGLGAVVARKLTQNFANLGGTWLTLLALGGIAVVALVLARPLRWAATAPDGGAYAWLSSGAPLSSLGSDAPMLRPGVIALAVALGIGFVVNDSGIVVPALGVSVAVPLLVTASATWLLMLRRRATDPAA